MARVASDVGAERQALPLRQRELLRTREIALLLGVSKQHVLDLLAEYQLPAPVTQLGGGHVWRTREVLDWVDAGCPRRDRWSWKPSKAVGLDDLLELLKRRAVALDEEVRDLERRKSAGETEVAVARRR